MKPPYDYAPLDSVQNPNEIKNYLFVIPNELSPLESAILAATINRVANYGYVYVADFQQAHTEDRDGARYMPFKNDTLPCFGSIDSVLVFHDAEYETLARRFYPEARIMIFNPTSEENAVHQREIYCKAA